MFYRVSPSIKITKKIVKIVKLILKNGSLSYLDVMMALAFGNSEESAPAREIGA
jgi:hypothetical protein